MSLLLHIAVYFGSLSRLRWWTHLARRRTRVSSAAVRRGEVFDFVPHHIRLRSERVLLSYVLAVGTSIATVLVGFVPQVIYWE